MDRFDEHYGLHHLALHPVHEGRLERSWNLPPDIAVSKFAQFIRYQRLHGLWLDALPSDSEHAGVIELKGHLEKASKLTAALELPQQETMRSAHEILTREQIPYFFAKGAQLRQTLYRQPWHRPAHDVDLFVKHTDSNRAVDLFKKEGFKDEALPETITHEIKLRKYNTDIDLHWHLMRPSRFRNDLNNWLFSRRQKFGEYWGLDQTASLLVMLAHPPITKYLVSPTSMLIHQADQLKLMNSGDINWEALATALEQHGLKTAAWSSICLLNKLCGRPVNTSFESAIMPTQLKRKYIEMWIDRAWITNWFERRWLVASGFSLALQDGLYNTIRAGALTLRNHTFKNRRQTPKQKQ